MNLVWELTLGWLITSGFVGFILMGIDKARAQDGSWRIPEGIFYRLAIAGGAFGILAGSSVFHHKTLKISFIGVILLAAAAWVVVLFGLLELLGAPLG
jgi:uncharacterized membrane protein YsdA (DUF1294 family)